MFRRVVLAPGAPRKARRLTGLYGQISRTVAVEVDFGQSLERKCFLTSFRFRSPWVAQASRPASSGDDSAVGWGRLIACHWSFYIFLKRQRRW